MTEVPASGVLSFGGLLIVALIAVGAPVLARAIPRVAVPSVVLEIVGGIVVGPSVLGWVEIDAPIAVLAVIGLVFLLFLAGSEIDVRTTRGDLLRLPLIGYALTIALGLAAGVAAGAAGWVDDPLFLAVTLSGTALGLIVPVLKDAGIADQPLGRYTIAGATVADFAAVILLSLVFSTSEGGTTSMIVSIAMFVVVVGITGLALGGASRTALVERTLVQLQDTTAAIRVRIAVALLVGFVALAADAGLELLLGAFVAGAVFGLADPDMSSHPHLRLKLDAIGYGFVIPVFFVASGIRFDLDALTTSGSALARVPVLVLALLVVRGVPAMLYRRRLGAERTRIAALLQATSLPFIVTAAEIGESIGAIDTETSAALVAAGLVSVVVFPAVALARLRRLEHPSPDAADVRAHAALPVDATAVD